MYTIENLGESDKQWDGEQWIVERKVNDEVERAWFTGPGAEQRAREYAAWKNERTEGT